jgi:hypothetical protein
MAKPTVLGTPTFNTSGHYAHIQVRISDDVGPPAGGGPTPDVTMVRVWGESQTTDKDCVDARATSQVKIETTYPTLPWDSEVDWSQHWFLYDDEQAYYRICVEVTFSDGSPQVYKCKAFKRPPSYVHDPLPEVELKDC